MLACVVLAAVAVPQAFAVDIMLADEIWKHGSTVCVEDTPATAVAGDPVVWHNPDSARHTLVGDAGASGGYSFVATMPAGGKASHTFNEPGNYSYYCAMRPHLGGVISVIEGNGSYYEYDPPLQGAVNKTTDIVWTDAVFGSGPTHNFVALCAGAVCLPTAAIFGTDPSGILSISTDGGNFPALGGAMGVDTYQTSASRYAIIAGSGNDGIQVLDISNRMSPVSAGYVYESDIPGVADPYDVEVYEDGTRHMALVTSPNQDSLQMLDVSRPSNIRDLGIIRDDETTALGGATYVDVVSAGTQTHALVSSREGIQIVNVTDGMVPVSSIIMNDTRGFDVTASGQYMVVAAGSSVQIINITDVSTPRPTSTINHTYTTDPAASHLDDRDTPDMSRLLPRNVAVYTIESGTYALVTWSSNHMDSGDGLQIINITDVSAPVHVTWIGDSDVHMLDGAYDVTAVSLKSKIYALVTAYRDGGLRVFDVSDPESPHLASSARFPGATHVSYADGCAIASSFETEGVYVVCLDAYAAMRGSVYPVGNPTPTDPVDPYAIHPRIQYDPNTNKFEITTPSPPAASEIHLFFVYHKEPGSTAFHSFPWFGSGIPNGDPLAVVNKPVVPGEWTFWVAVIYTTGEAPSFSCGDLSELPPPGVQPLHPNHPFVKNGMTYCEFVTIVAP